MELLNDMALFVEVVKAKGFRAAAEATGTPNSTLSRRIQELEKGIGLRLLHRTTRKIELTEAGQIYFERCKRIVDEARLAHEQLGEMLAEPSGVLRASLPVDFAASYLAPLIAEFAALYPKLSFEFDLTPRRVDLVSEPFDLAVRVGESEDSQLIARSLVSLTSRLYAAPAYLEKRAAPTHPSELAEHQCLNIHKSGTWRLQKDGQAESIKVSGRFAMNSVSMIRRMATLGAGVLLVPPLIVEADVRDGSLVPVLSEWRGAPMTIYAMTETRLLPAKTQRFIEFLQDRLRAIAAGQER